MPGLSDDPTSRRDVNAYYPPDLHALRQKLRDAKKTTDVLAQRADALGQRELRGIAAQQAVIADVLDEVLDLLQNRPGRV